MGDMADYAIEQALEYAMWNPSEGILSRGSRSSHRRYPSNYAHDEDTAEDEDNYHSRTPRAAHSRKACKFCGVGGLHWVTIDGKWRLFNELDEQHVCLGGERPGVACKHCGMAGLRWNFTNERWSLQEPTGAFHNCRGR